MGKIAGWVVFAVLAVFGLLIVFGSFFKIDQGERGVYLRNGAYVRTVDAGLGFKFPIFDDVKRFSLRTHIVKVEADEAYSYDQQPANVSLSVNYSLNPERVAAFYNRFGTQENMETTFLYPRIRKEFKVVFGTITGQVAITERQKLNDAAAAALQVALGDMVTIEGFQLEDAKFSDEYVKTINQRMQAQINVETEKQNALKEAQIATGVVNKANGDRDAQIARAEGQAREIELLGNAEAGRILARATALRDNPSLVTLTMAERWNGVLPTTMVPGGVVPMLNLPTTR